jgi:hypothetical protein
MLFALPFSVSPFADVTKKSDEDQIIGLRHWGDGELDRKLFARASQPPDFDAPAKDLGFAGFQISAQPARMCLTVLRWDDEVGHQAAPHFIGGPTEHGGGIVVPIDHRPSVVHNHDRIESGLKDQAPAGR